MNKAQIPGEFINIYFIFTNVELEIKMSSYHIINILSDVLEQKKLS